MKKRILSMILAICLVLSCVPITVFVANAAPAEQFNLTPGGTYWFDLSGENIPGTVNTGTSFGAVSVPDTTLHYVPFTYAGTVDAYKLTSEMQTTEDYAEQNKYPHSLFVADYAVTHTVSWDELNTAGLIFGKSYTGGSVDYTLRAPSVGSWQTVSGDSERGTPQSNEWDAVLDKNSGYIKNWNGMLSRGQDTPYGGQSYRAIRGHDSARSWSYSATVQIANVGFRPVLEVLNTDTLGPDGLKAVTLDLNGGKLGGSTDNIQIIVKNGAAFTAPASDGLTAPTEYNATGFKWQDSDGNLYAPGDSVPAGVTLLTAKWVKKSVSTEDELREALDAGATSIKLVGDINLSSTLDLTDKNITLDLNGYVLTGDIKLADSSASPDSILTLIDSNPTATHADSSLPAGGVVKGNITLTRESGSVSHLYANGGTVTGQTSLPSYAGGIFCTSDTPTAFTGYVGNYGEIHGGIFYAGINESCIKENTVTFMNGDSRYALEVVASGNKVVAPVSTPLKAGYDFVGWYNGDTKYEFNQTITSDITLTAQWTPDTYTVTLHLNDGTIASGKDVTEYTYGTGATLPTADDITREGYTFEGWYEDNSFSGSPVTEIGKTDTGKKEFYAKWKDVTCPTGEITVDKSKWNTFFNNITFGLFFKDTQKVTITASDNSGDNVTITYLLSDKELTVDELNASVFTAYTGAFYIEPNNEYVIYAKLTDSSGNICYINSNGVVLDNVDPLISGIIDGKTYCEAQTVTIDEKYVDSVTVDGTAVTLTDGKFTLSPADGKQTIVVTDKAGNKAEMTVTVNDGHTAGNDDGDCSTPVYCIYHPDTVVVAAKSHDFSGEWHNDGTGHWHVCQNDGCTISETEIPHSGTDDGDCTTAVICECGYVITAANAEHSYGEWQSNGDGTHTRYCTVDGCNGYEDGYCEGGQATYFKKAVCDECNEAYGELLTDKTAPTGEISIGTNKWNSFLNTITFGLFFKDTQSVTITAADDSYDHDGYTDDKAVNVEYYLYSGDTALTKEDLASKEFTIYDGGFNINPDNKYVIYARLTDHAGNVTYISSEGVVLDASAPVISGVENGKTYCEAQTVTVTEEYIESVKVNGTAVTLDANNQFTLNPAEGTQTIVATDKAGNVSAEITVTVNDGHTYEWQSENGQYWKKCQYCGDETAKQDIPTITIDAPDTVCRTQDCEASVTLPDGITDAVLTYEFMGLGGTIDTTVEDGRLYGDVTANGYSDVENSFNLVVYATTDDGFPFTVSKTVQIQNEHAGGVATCTELAICDTCGEPYGEVDSTNHNLEKISAKNATVTETGNTEYWHCLDCGKYFADENGENEIELADTVIAKLPPEIIEGMGQSLTEGESKELTFRSNAAFGDFLRVELDGKTLDEKNYTVKEGSTVVTLKADYVATLSAGEHTIGIVSESGTATTTFIVNAKAVVDNDTKSPQTGDNSRMALWIALLFVSGAGVIGTTVYGKKKRAK